MSKLLRILIAVPEITARGGVTTYFQVLKRDFTQNVFYLERGNRSYPNRKFFLVDIFRIIKDLTVYLWHIGFKSYDLVQTNTSLYRNSIIRDSAYILLANLFRKKTIVFFHGWDEELESKIEKRLLPVFRFIYFKADTCIVLAQSFKDKLNEWGYKKPVYVETTLVDKELTRDYHVQDILKKYQNSEYIANILFLARIEKSKGIYEAIKTFEILKVKYPHLSLTIAGDGLELDNIRKYISDRAIKNVSILGFQTGKEITRTFKEADVYFFPSYTEGMPTSVLEAMAFGLPVITRPVGGVKDFFEHDRMGYLTESLEPSAFAGLFELMFQHPEKMKEMALYNYDYAQSHFLSDIVANRIEQIYYNTISE